MADAEQILCFLVLVLAVYTGDAMRQVKAQTQEKGTITFSCSGINTCAYACTYACVDRGYTLFSSAYASA